MYSFLIAHRMIGDGCPAYIICEIGINHQGDFELARCMVQQAAACGAESVKFQWERPETKVIRGEEEYDELAELLFTRDQMAQLFREAAALNMACSAVISDEEDMAFIRSLGADYFKIESDDLTHLDLIRAIGNCGAALMLSTGVATLAQVDRAVRAFLETGNRRLVILHTVSSYPTSDEYVNLAVLDTYKSCFPALVGYCDHCEDDLPVLAAAARGVAVIEKHFTLDRSANGFDWEVSLEPDEFAKMCRAIRRIESMTGDGRKTIFPPETGMDRLIRRSIVAARDISAGNRVQLGDIIMKKPGNGMPPEMKPFVLGKVARVFIPANTLITPEMI